MQASNEDRGELAGLRDAVCRRDFLYSVGATVLSAAGASAIPSVLPTDIAQAAGAEGATPLDKTIDDIRRAVKSRDIDELMQGKGKRMVSRFLQAFRGPLDRDAVRGTKYDASEERKRHCMQIAYWHEGDKMSNRLVPADSGEGKFMSPTAFGYGNGFYFGRRDKIITAQHVIDFMNNQQDSMLPLDIGVISVNKRAWCRPEQLVQDDTSLSDQDIHGEYVTVEGVDPDGTSEHGCKSYPGVAMKLSREWVYRVFTGNTPEKNERLVRSFAIILPRGESTGATPAERPTAGMSGSPVFMLRNGTKVLAGIFHGSHPTQTDPETGVAYDIGFFYGIEGVREIYVSHMRRS